MKPNDGYICYIVNPKAGPGSSRLIVQQFAEYLGEKGFEVRTNYTSSLEEACQSAGAAADDSNCAMVVAAGGDGTVREVAHGLEGGDKPLLILPCGTENLLANELGLDGKLKTTIKAFNDNFVQTLDLGNANGQCFTSIAGFGFDGDVVKRVSDQRLGHIGYLDYFWPIWRTFWSYKFGAINVKIDGQEVFDGPGLVFVGNISRYALGLQILHHADFGDGLLDVCIYKCAGRAHLLKHSVMTILERHADKSDVIYQQCRNVFVSSTAGDIKTEIDGDPGPELPMEITIMPQAIKVMVPKGAVPAGIRTRLARIFR